MATLVVRGPDNFNEEREVSGEVTIGRADNNDLILTAGGVSRRHARVYLEDGQVVVEDSGSANGTFISGNKIKGPQPLKGDVKVLIGDYELSLKAGPARRPTPGKAAPALGSGGSGPGARAPTRVNPAARATTPSKGGPPVLGGNGGAPPTRTLAKSGKPMTDAALLTRDKSGKVRGAGGANRVRSQSSGSMAPVDGPQLKGLTGPWAGKTFAIPAKMTVGRVAGVTLQLDDDSVSRKHAELEATEEGVLLRDLGSANGTAVNGVPVTPGDEGVALTPGDIVQFGVVELQFQDREDAPYASTSQTPQIGGGKKKLIFIGAGAVVLLLGGGLALKLSQGGKPPPRMAMQQPQTDTPAQIEEYLNTCRSYASTELGSEPNWDKAKAACSKVLDADPINDEGLQLTKRIDFERENFAHYEAAERAMKLGREDQALEEYSKIGEGSTYYLRVKSRIAAAVDQALRRTQDECNRYVRNSEWRAAYEPCGQYMRFRCQTMDRDELYPPPGFVMRIDDSGFVRKNEWRPGEPMYRKFLRVRKKIDPGAPSWECERLAIIKAPENVESPLKRVEKALKVKYQDRMLWNALVLYWQGKDNESNNQFLKIVEDVSKADLHRQSEELRRDAAAVASFFKAGQTSLQQDDVEGAAKSFEEAWNLDAKLMGELAEKEPSFWRINIGADLAEKSYDRGKYYADRQDPVRACRIWKTAFKYYKGNTSINKAIGFCSSQATAIFANAGSCEDLRNAIAFAVPGDGIEEKAAQRRGELGCPAQ